ncbi:unnamed protein product [Trifolium pratense]|uniref:Uncharacterized protein n=1 Tax=Trifolium pratense TaxID=57577 RepID=A0ACB0K561_TRIPR|nr:unnamed protein product [Trifolium pratense]
MPISHLSYEKRIKDMAKIVNFVQTLIIFLSLIVLAIATTDRKSFFHTYFKIVCSVLLTMIVNTKTVVLLLFRSAFGLFVNANLSKSIMCPALLTRIVKTMIVVLLILQSAFGLFVPANLGKHQVKK